MIIDEPLSWRVSAVIHKEKLDGYGNEPWTEDFKTKDEADLRKVALQAKGCVATVTPVLLTKSTRSKIRKKHQVQMFA